MKIQIDIDTDSATPQVHVEQSSGTESVAKLTSNHDPILVRKVVNNSDKKKVTLWVAGVLQQGHKLPTLGGIQLVSNKTAKVPILFTADNNEPGGSFFISFKLTYPSNVQGDWSDTIIKVTQDTTTGKELTSIDPQQSGDGFTSLPLK